MLVLTFSHCVTDSLLKIGNCFHQAKENFFSQWMVKEIFSSLGILGRVSAPETTWSSANGFHPHEHILFFLTSVTAERLEAARVRLFPYWEKACEKAGLSSVFERFYFEFGYTSYLSQYVNKCAREVTLSDIKKARVSGGVSHYSPFQLLAEFDETGKPLFSKLFREYAIFNRGRKSHNWSRGLARELGVKQYAEDKASQTEDIKRLSETGFRVILNQTIFRSFSPLQQAFLLSCSLGSDGLQGKSKQRLFRFGSVTKNSVLRSAVEAVEIKGQTIPADALYKTIGEGGVS